MIPRTYHCVNRFLYATSTLLVLAVCVFKLHTQSWQQILQLSGDNYQNIVALIAAVVTFIWGGYFLLLRYRVDEQGVSKAILRRQSLLWQDITDIQLEEIDQNSQAQRKLTFSTEGKASITLSSELLSLENLEELTADLREEGKLPQATSPEA